MPYKMPSNIFMLYKFFFWFVPREKIHRALAFIFTRKYWISLNPGNSVSYIQKLSKLYFSKNEVD